MNDSGRINPQRRKAILGAGLAAAGALSLGSKAQSAQTAAASSSPAWDHEADIVCVGTGAAACSAAVAAADLGASVILLEKLPLPGGTTGKSGGVAWIANNRFLRARGVKDAKEDCLRYFARYAYPNEYAAGAPNLGLAESSYRLLEAFYDNGARAIENLERVGAVRFQEFTMWFVNKQAPDYADHLPENKVPRGRAIEPEVGAGGSLGGGSLVAQMHDWLRKHGANILLEHAVTGLVKDGERVVGVEARNGAGAVRVHARRAVIFGTGGYAHNPELIARHQPGLYGSCAMPGSTGDFIAIAGAAGARMGALGTAWRTQVVLEEALENRAVGLGAFVLPGDSMIVVNRYGRRIVNEKINYNDRTQVHFAYDPVRKEYPNHVQFMIFDERTLDAFAGAFPIPTDRRASRFLVQGATLGELGEGIAARLARIGPRVGNCRLDPAFSAELARTVTRFNGFARLGRDEEFSRGEHDYDRDWQLLFSPMREGTKQPRNPHPNPTLHPLSDQGPYFAFLLGAGALDTNGGPEINEHAQVLDAAGRPIPGLYGAGNCVASPSRGAYFGAGGTIGPALTFGFIAGRHAVSGA